MTYFQKIKDAGSIDTKMVNAALFDSKNMEPLQLLPWGLVNKFCNIHITDIKTMRRLYMSHIFIWNNSKNMLSRKQLQNNKYRISTFLKTIKIHIYKYIYIKI